MKTKRALIEALRELVRVVLIAVLPVLIVSIEQNSVDWKMIGILAIVATLKALDRFVNKWEGTELTGITGV